MSFREMTRVNTCKTCRKLGARVFRNGEIVSVSCPCGATVVMQGPKVKPTDVIKAWNVSLAVSW